MQLYEHQKQALDLCDRFGRYGLFWEPGTGKTIAMLALQKAKPRRTLVIGPRVPIATAWQKDAKALGIEFVNAMHSNKAKRMQALRTPGDVVVGINFDQFRTTFRDIAQLGFERFIIDESSKIKNRKTKTAEACWAMSDRVDECYILSGTPRPNDPSELWSQVRAMDPEFIERSFYRWAGKWFNAEERYRGTKRYVAGYSFKSSEHEQRFNAALGRRVWALSKRECLELPDVLPPEEWTFELSDREQSVYEDVREETLSEIDNNPAKLRSGTTLIKLRQCTSGWLRDREGHEHEIGTSKLDTLAEVVENVRAGVIWCEFHRTADAVMGLLRSLDRKPLLLDGRTSKYATDIVSKFVDGEADFVVAHPAAAGHGTDGLQRRASTAIFYDLSFSSEQHLQALGRLDRNGQTEAVRNVYLLAKDTIDEAMFAVLVRKIDAQAATLASLKRQPLVSS